MVAKEPHFSEYLNVKYTSSTVTGLTKLFRACVNNHQTELIAYMLEKTPTLMEVLFASKESLNTKIDFRGVLEEQPAFKAKMMAWIRQELESYIESKPSLSELMDTFDSFYDNGTFFSLRGNYLLEYPEFRNRFKVFYKEHL